MGRPNKGARAYHMVKFHPDVLRRLAERAAAAGVSSLSQFGADVLALHVGMPEHVRELNQTSMDIDTSTDTQTRKADEVQGDAYGRLMIRPPREVTERLVGQALGRPISPYIADILTTHVGMPELVRNRTEEVLPLAI